MKTSYAAAIAVAVVVVLATVAAAAIYMPQTSQVQSNSTTGQSTSTSNTSTVATSSSGTGQFAMMATDPPITASGVTDASVHYTGAAVHKSGSPSQSGWVALSGSGTIDLTGTVNASQTIAKSTVQSGTYDMVRLNITSGTVVYQGANYTAAIASGTATSKLVSDAQVTGGASSAAIVDLRTFVINTGTSSSPQFVINASANATSVPPSFVTSASLQVGSRASLQGQVWWRGFEDQTSTNLIISSASLTGGSLQLQLKNSGNATAKVQTVVIAPVSASGSATLSLPTSLSGSAVFTAGSNGTLQASNSLQGAVLLTSAGAQLNSGSTSSLNYSGTISLSFGLVSLQLSGVVSGQQYLVVAMGPGTFAEAIVTAQ